MNKETILTPEQVDSLLEGVLRASGSRLGNYTFQKTLDELRSAIRDIEQAVLQSLPVQTSSTIRGDSYAGVYIWWGRDNITQHIPKSLAENESNPHGLLKCVASECIRDLEQAVLQSPEVQALKRDKERLDWLADPENSIGNVQLPTACVEHNPHSMRDAIDEAMEWKE